MRSTHTAEGPATDHGMADTISGWAAAPTGRRLTRRSNARAEYRRLQRKLSFLAMQKDYWRQRCNELTEAHNAAEAELAHLRRVVGETTGRPVLTR